MSAVGKVARLLGVPREELLDSMRYVMDPDKNVVSLTARAPRVGGLGSYGVREGSTLWRVADDLEVEPERLRDAILQALDVKPGKIGRIGCRRLIARVDW